MEIERKFLFNKGKTFNRDSPSFEITQHYIPFLRIRKTTNVNKYSEYFLTYKRGRGLVRVEHEWKVSSLLFDVLALWPFKTTIKKKRHIHLRDAVKEIVVDEFHDKNGLTLVEVEFESLHFAEAFKPENFEFLGKEVTNSSRYTNKYLAGGEI